MGIRTPSSETVVNRMKPARILSDSGDSASTVRTAPAAARWGLAVALVSAAAFGSSGGVAKGLLVSGWSPGAVVTVRVAGAALLLVVPTVIAMRGRWAALLAQWRVVTAYGFLGVAVCQLAYFNAVTHVSVGVALLLEYLAPVLIVGWLWLRHRRRPRRLTVLGVVLALVGLLLVLDLIGAGPVDALGVVWGLVAAVGLSGYFLLAGDAEDAVPPIALAGGGLIVGAVVLGLAGLVGALPMAASARRVDLAGADVPWWVPLIELAVVSAALAYATGVLAVRALGSKVASFVGLTEVLFAVLFAWVLLGELPGPVQLLGGVAIVGGVLAVRLDEQRGEPAVPAPTDADFCVPSRLD